MFADVITEHSGCIVNAQWMQPLQPRWRWVGSWGGRDFKTAQNFWKYLPLTELGLSAGCPYPSSCPSLMWISEWATNTTGCRQVNDTVKKPGSWTVHLWILTLFWGAHAKVGEKKILSERQRKIPKRDSWPLRICFLKKGQDILLLCGRRVGWP